MVCRAVLVLLAGLAASSSQAQTAPDEQARRLLEDGRGYRKDGKLKQALDNFNTILSGFPNTDSVDDALLEIGRYHVEVEGDYAKGREAFEQVAQRFPQSDGAPGAYHHLGLLTLNRATTPAELDDALAQFDRVQRLYPKSEWVPRALHASGLVHRRAGRLAEAVEAQRRVSLEYPSSDAAAAAQFQIGHCLALLGQPRQAMEEFQQVRNRFPDGERAVRALERITALYRLHGEEQPRFALDGSYSLAAGDVLKDVRALLMTPSGTLWLGSEKTKSAVPFDAAGKMGPSVPAVDVRSLSLTPQGELLVTAKLAVRIGPKDVRSLAIPGDKPEPESLDRLTAAVMTPDGDLLVADEKRKRAYRFLADGTFKGPFPDDAERKVSRLVVDGEGAVTLLDEDARVVQVVDPRGKVLRTLGPRGPGFELRRPSDIAVDPFRNLYVADAEAGVFVFSSQGQLLTQLGGPDLRRPRALTLDPTGAVLVYDEKLEKVVRFR